MIISIKLTILILNTKYGIIKPYLKISFIFRDIIPDVNGTMNKLKIKAIPIANPINSHKNMKILKIIEMFEKKFKINFKST